ncbi:MAG: DUF2029 domain-containing protein [Chloroflexi bacterium]|uniref:DUF2029 domain-containing protein n=1 Tax=Candidatus Chlorohelix allophototropha TaxID=3003348 RepID=A0A8T7M511_9CHLR|nr:DUF2029 domain-containing protein [Chloroflexota bacterium]WJW69099.1 DUF2029 domain-containing protein [Chloroflexota bacterium L227-S17]
MKLRLTLTPVIIALVMLCAALAAELLRPAFVIDFGGDDRIDQLYFQVDQDGFYNPEKRPGADPNYRWIGKEAVLRPPWTLESIPLKATLLATAPRPDRTPDKVGTTLNVYSLNGTNTARIGAYALIGLFEGSKLTFQIPANLIPDFEKPRLRFEATETYQPGKGDTRQLSAILLNLTLEPDYAAFGWKDWLGLLLRPLLLAIISLSVWAIAGLFTRRNAVRLVLEVGAGTTLVSSLLFWWEGAEPFYAPWAALLPLAWLLIWLSGKFAAAAPGLPAPLVYAATLLAGMPLAQLLFGRMPWDLQNPNTLSFIGYSAALLLSLGVYLLARFRFETIFLWVFLGITAALYLYTHWYVFDQNLYRGADFRNYYRALLDTQEGQRALYIIDEMGAAPGRAIRSSPAFALFYEPLVWFFGRDIVSAIFWWRLANELLLLPTVLILMKIFNAFVPGKKMWAAVLFLTLGFGQFAETIAYGQQNNLILFGLALTALWVKQKRDTLAGLALSIPVWVKLLPAVSGVFFLIERRWKGLIGLVLGALLVNALTIPVVGWDNWWFYFTRAMWNVNAPELGITNQSFWGFMGRVVASEVRGDFTTAYPAGLAPVGYLVALCGFALTMLTVWRARGGSDISQQLILGALTVVALWTSPFSWMHYIVPGLVAFVALAAALSTTAESRSRLIIFGLVYAVLAYGGRNEFFFTEAVGLEKLGSSYRFFATFGLWALNLWSLWQPASATKPAPSVVSKAIALPLSADGRE